MANIQRIRDEIKKLYKAFEDQGNSLPPAAQTLEWVSCANMYMKAATIIANNGFGLFRPQLMLTGHAVESALKACLIATRGETPNQHDLVLLYELAEKHGIKLGEFEKAALVHLGHFYFQDLATGSKFKIRYPTKTTEHLGGAIPENSAFKKIVESLCEQATAKKPINLQLLADKNTKRNKRGNRRENPE